MVYLGRGTEGLSRYFSLERLVNIYIQVVGIVTNRPAVGYGDASLYCTVRTQNPNAFGDIV
jgi:hypothetical protein